MQDSAFVYSACVLSVWWYGRGIAYICIHKKILKRGKRGGGGGGYCVTKQGLPGESLDSTAADKNVNSSGIVGKMRQACNSYGTGAPAPWILGCR